MSLRKTVVCDMCGDEMDVMDDHQHFKRTVKPNPEVYYADGEPATYRYYDLCCECWKKVRQFIMDNRPAEGF